ncbi:unnamed protein product [Adineta ricciae]|uniref:ADP ribosyltransferase domain-containing protein n=1 Tax=Adineta ricciae TaxID=249248 RepID=A0A814F7I6_ADIRI|nr:unnamed protein product [Adineta ricciae]CAF1035403.1 unnamed protein product [Adineta ricciae]
MSDNEHKKYSSLGDLSDEAVVPPRTLVKGLQRRFAFLMGSNDNLSDVSDKTSDWIFSKHHATSYARAIEYDCVKDRGIAKTVQKLEDADVIPHDDSEESKLLRFYLNEARNENNALYLLLFILNTVFYKKINSFMVSGSPKIVYDKLCREWSGYYAGLLMRNPALHIYRYKGIVYRGMTMFTQNLQKSYKVQDRFTNRTFQSTSKSWEIAAKYVGTTPAKLNETNVIMIYEIVDSRFALDVEKLSQYPDEREVLLLPGCLFEVQQIDNRKTPIQICVEQLVTYYA